jgi:hypothetical protein
MDQVICDIATGIALHTLQDTFSHQGFIGLWHADNNCWPWQNFRRKQYGHTDMLKIPDMIEHQWTDQRSGTYIDNHDRAKDALIATASVFDVDTADAEFTKILDVINISKYDERKAAWAKLSNTSNVRFSTNKAAKLQRAYVKKWVKERKR